MIDHNTSKSLEKRIPFTSCQQQDDDSESLAFTVLISKSNLEKQ